MQLLWRGVVVYLDRYAIDVMFGCGSVPGTDPEKLKLPLSYLQHFHSVPEGQRVSARPELYVSMNRMAKDDIDPKEALRSLPPLIKGYVRAGLFRRRWCGDRQAIRHHRCPDLFPRLAHRRPPAQQTRTGIAPKEEGFALLPLRKREPADAEEDQRHAGDAGRGQALAQYQRREQDCRHRD
jgi:putative hemolysin